MTTYILKALILISLTLNLSSAFAAECSAKKPEACLSSPQIMWAEVAPNLTVSDVLAGADHHVPLLADTVLTCAYRYHPKSETSPKFRCFRTAADNFRTGLPVYFNNSGELIPNAVTVGAEDTELEDLLLDSRNQPILRADGKKAQKGEEYKVKYFTGGAQQGSHFEGSKYISASRESEGFTETAASRVFWILGYPADRMYNVAQVNCFGCSADPFVQTEFKNGSTATFYDAAIEKKYDAKKLYDGWSWNDVVSRYFNSWSLQTKLDFEGLILAAQLISYGNDLSKQNRMMCEESSYNKDTKECGKPIPMINDLGSSFGGLSKKLFGTNPRGSLVDYLKLANSKENRRVFTSADCEVKYPLGGYSRISQQGLDAFKERLKNLNLEKIRAVFTAAKFGRMEPDVLQHYNNNESTVIEIWSQELHARVLEIMNKRCGVN